MNITQCHFDLISKIYDLPLKPENWQPVLDQFSNTMGAYGASLHIFDPTYALHQTAKHTSNYATDLRRVNLTLEEYNERFAEHEHPTSMAFALRETRGFISDFELMGYESIEAYLEHPPIKFFNENLGVAHRAASKLTLNGAWSDILSLQFTNDRDQISGNEIEIGSLFVDHFAKSIELGRSFGVLKSRFDGVFTALDRFHIGIFVLSANGSVVVKNLEADRILDAGDGLSLSREGFLQPSNEGKLQGELKDAINKAIHTAQAQHNRAETLFTLSRRSGMDPYLIEVAPIRDRDEIESNFKGCLVFVIDPTNTEVVSTDGMQALYQLTGSESEICKLLADGYKADEVAETRNVSLGTVRSQIRSLFDKTQTNSQVDLVRLALTVNLPIDPAASDD